ncbi:23S rRNA (pseudouridine(1915)-N(3))-methyltransferase RlmH [Candidatus Peribacteria bacterium]|jgi:23S rRNA (pseudouridine1915-N3)-methyltransferase|nr:23S rRNA (pseudouridine(1915)-N(3))-methyltransferase RlmH [Candidatus Peribacteria bacterium]MBT4020973.1 23S rRNA (pseudouridine(1915)-N(3))-methyltransferase RlmH [Candidatus Peribacteria bacterium]MBT4240323.1 23S rRNA (pseudouridine(1915)-N(3))-methyltransferase RlmH [Candidatus Peribacteria bacterium]MBT4474079.1 23S rRNA (pseudouridine(1915)-N(3))-methyltransferase RlmH [Candidatus Peribacteria bacterium]
MQKVRLITVGKIKISWVQEGLDEYKKRISRFVDLEIVELSPSKEKDPSKQSCEETERLLKSLRDDEFVVALDETGKNLNTEDFAKILSDQNDIGKPVTFVIGGAYGFDDRVKERADMCMCLGSLTLPHELVRIVFLEGLYRALDLSRGGSYHHK